MAATVNFIVGDGVEVDKVREGWSSKEWPWKCKRVWVVG
jgi:hypothetical protein